jgi:hypothetical protein
MIHECGAVNRMGINSGNRSSRTKPSPVPLCPPQIPRDLTWDGNGYAAVGGRRLTARAVARSRIQWGLTVGEYEQRN